MAAERSLAVGVSYLGFADPGDGVPGTDFTQLKTIEENSVVFNFSDNTTVNFRAEGMSDPWASFDKAGDPDSVEFNIPSPTPDELKMLCGGTVTGNKWAAPTNIQNVRKTLKIQTTPYAGKFTEYIFTNCKVSAKINQAPNSEQTDLLMVRASKMAAISEAGVQGDPWSREVKTVESVPEG
ncbi:MAG: hypothetical protein LBV32_03175 [Tannerellaceae bacterium]|jgi:hypothetical protein|nr:hypothetical protein [Tannerellaceae bacterium]